MAKVRKPRRPKTELAKRIDAADALARAIVRSRGYCQAAGKDHIRCGGVIQWCHIEGRDNKRLRWETYYNALAMCAGHHVWYTHNPRAWWEFIEKNFPEQYAYIMEHKNEKVKTSLYLEEVMERLKEEHGEN